ncbi:MAG: hypothetical protein ACRELV_07605 [Longimicrobiales bacterium]
MTRTIATLLATLAVAQAAACGAEGLADRLGGADTQTSSPATTPAVAAGEPDESAADEGTRPRQIYYDLTLYDWYRRGEPLRVDGVPYELAGVPIRIEEPLELRGTHAGVDYYSAGEDAAVVFVPVFEAYWQPFAAAGVAAAAEE